MSDMTWFTILSTLGAVLAIAIGVMFPAIAMGRSISQALDALARQPEAEKAITINSILLQIRQREFIHILRT